MIALILLDHGFALPASMRTSMGVVAFSSTPISLRRARTSTIRLCRSLIPVQSSVIATVPPRLRITRQRNRLRRRIAVVERMPDFFGEERHEGREQPQRGFKDLHQRRQRGFCLPPCPQSRQKSSRSLTISRYQSQKLPQKN